MSGEDGDVEGPAPTAPRRSKSNGVLADVWHSFERATVTSLRHPFVTFASLVQPVVFFVLLAAVFGAVASGPVARHLGGDVSYVAYLTPAVVVQSALAAASFSGVGLVTDMDSGMFEKLLVSPMGRGAMLFGKLLSELARIVVQTLVILALASVFLVVDPDAAVGSYLQAGVTGVVGVLAVTVLFAGVFVALSNVVALVTRDDEATVAVANVLTFPLLFVSSAFLPLAMLPDWVRAVAVLNPVTYGVDGVRAFVLGRDVGTVLEVTAFPGLWNTVVPAVAVLLACNVVLGAVAVRMLDRASSADVR